MNQKKRVIALGFFDGVHLGHGALLRRVKERAEALDAVPTALTFDRHPASAITGDYTPLLTNVDDRAWLMQSIYGMDKVVIAEFSSMMRMNWRDFVVHYLVEQLNVVHIVAGHDFHFGYMGEGNPKCLQNLCISLGIGCDIIEKVEQNGITISSTYIRTLLAQGEMARAVAFLGHPHVLTGQVKHGQRLGSTKLGFPTVNLRIPDGVIIPAFGVYVTAVSFDGARYMAVTNIGVRPTVKQNDGRVTVEAFLLDFEGDLYDKTVRIEFYHFLRGERQFPDFAALSTEIERNAMQTRAFFSACAPQ